jgi:GDP-4-dehydro-6-deoxy-D-mannose reductase
VAFDVQDDPALTRPVDEPVRIGDPGRIRALGWQPRIPLEQSLRDVLAYWRGIA